MSAKDPFANRLILRGLPASSKAKIDLMSEPHSSIDDIIELYKKDVDRTLIRENLMLTPTQRLERLEEAQRFVDELRKNRRDKK